MPRVIRWFNKDDEWEAGAIKLPNISISELKAIFPNEKRAQGGPPVAYA